MGNGIEIIAFTLDFIGKVLIALVAIMVHRKVMKEKKIDKKVLRGMKLEEFLGVLGILFILIGYLLHLSLLI